eukprot:62223-Rhodomonas_salina.2
MKNSSVSARRKSWGKRAPHPKVCKRPRVSKLAEGRQNCRAQLPVSADGSRARESGKGYSFVTVTPTPS